MTINEINKACIAGLACSGISLCELLLSLGKKVKVTEAKDKDNFSV